MKTLTFTKPLLLVFLSFVFLNYGSLSHAAKPEAPKVVGQVVWIKGTLQGQMPNAEPRTLKRHSAIYEHETIKTSSGSEGKISFKNNSVLLLHENSTIKIDQYWHPEKKEADSFFKSMMDSIRAGLRAITSTFTDNEPGGYKVEPAPVTD